jgi:hypothetical protein
MADREQGDGGSGEPKKKKTSTKLSSKAKANMRKLPETLHDILTAVREAREASLQCGALIPAHLAAVWGGGTVQAEPS